jgi:hypothetical protein
MRENRGWFHDSFGSGRAKETSVRKNPYLPADNYHAASFFSARKHGLVDAGVRVKETDRTVFVALPGGVGTLDEFFEVLALIQLRRIGSAQTPCKWR